MQAFLFGPPAFSIAFEPFDLVFAPFRLLRRLVTAPLERLARTVDVGGVLERRRAPPGRVRGVAGAPRYGIRKRLALRLQRRLFGRKPSIWMVFDNLNHLS